MKFLLIWLFTVGVTSQPDGEDPPGFRDPSVIHDVK